MPSFVAPTFADASAGWKEARYVILGVPFDRTTSFRPGARFGPDAIRQHSWNFETYNFEVDLDLSEVPIHDLGNLEEFGSAADMVRGVQEAVRPIWEEGKFPITLGGDHACAPPVVEAIPRDFSLGVLYIDAHLDFRNEYLGDRRSHACSARRMVDRLGARNVVVLGVRSMSRDEKEDNDRIGMPFFSSDDIQREGIAEIARRALDQLRTEKVYISLDIDGVDPAYAPATGTPEPFGLTPLEVKRVIDLASPRLVGLDIMEVSPPWDQGNTSALAARLAREAILRVERYRRDHAGERR
jgi:agmatinase